MQNAYFYDPAVVKFQVLLEEVTRAKPGSPENRFVAPDAQSLDRLQAKFHHVLFGRRGTGKSSLLRRVEGLLRDRGHLVAWADQETYSGLSYPDVLVGTLADIFRQFAEQIDLAPLPKKRKQRRVAEKANSRLAALLREAVVRLQELKAAPSESEIFWTATFSETASELSEVAAGATAQGRGARIGFGWRRGRKSDATRGKQVETRFTANKRDHLERAVVTYRELISAVSKVYPDAYVMLDDFYRLNESDQPHIAGYFHRVVKDTAVWLKFGSIPFWTKLYIGGSQSVGLQVQHDVREVSLDRGLPDFKSSKRFLESILHSLADEVGVDMSRLFSDGAMDRLVLASGAVPRDYIGLVSDAIGVAQNRDESDKSGTDRVIVEDVNYAAGRTVAQKFLDLDEDAGAHAVELRTLIVELTNHCRQTGSACFLVDALDTELGLQLGRLQNMRFIHLIDSNESLPDLMSSRYVVYLLDVSQLAAQRAWKVDFMSWTKREKRRARKLIFPAAAQPPAPKKNRSTKSEPDTQPVLFEADAIVGDIDGPNSTDPVRDLVL